MDDALPLDLKRLGEVSRRLACAVFQVFPELAEHAAMVEAVEPDGLSLQVSVESPSGDEDRAMRLFIDKHVGPTLIVGPCHIHVWDHDYDEFVDLLGAILDDQMVIIEDSGLLHACDAQWLDLREIDALEDFLTDPDHSGRANLRSWTGWGDREVSVDTL
jgi:hypothetical protein